jgi:hypothetical protein
MSYVKKCQHGKKIVFKKIGGYVYHYNAKGRSAGPRGKQICRGGGYMGSTIMARNESQLKSSVDRWIRNARRKSRENMNTCYACGEDL